MTKRAKKSSRPRRVEIEAKPIESDQIRQRNDVSPKLRVPLARPKGWRQRFDGYFYRILDAEQMLEIFRVEGGWMVTRRTGSFRPENLELLRHADEPLRTQTFQGAMCAADHCHLNPQEPWCWIRLEAK